MSTIHERLAADQTQLMQALGLAPYDARMEAHLLMARALDVNRAWLLAHDDEALAPAAVARYTDLLERRLAGEPIAYIFGAKEFYGLMFKVSPAVLIPRPETELLVELALARIAADRPCRVLDLGTGSGAVAITLAKLRPHAHMVAVDINAEALAVARENARHLGADNVCFVQSNWFSELNTVEKFDIIVSNPPYIAAQDPHLARGGLEFEPRLALVSGPGGEYALNTIIHGASGFLKRGGWLLLEHGYDQGAFTRSIFSVSGYVNVQTHIDLSGADRVTAATVD